MSRKTDGPYVFAHVQCEHDKQQSAQVGLTVADRRVLHLKRRSLNAWRVTLTGDAKTTQISLESATPVTIAVRDRRRSPGDSNYVRKGVRSSARSGPMRLASGMPSGKDLTSVRIRLHFESDDPRSPEAWLDAGEKCIYHLEACTSHSWWMALYGDNERVDVYLWSKTKISARVDDGKTQRWLARKRREKRKLNR